MVSILDYPEVQSAVAPFLTALILAWILYRLKPAVSGLALAAGFLVTALLATHYSLLPLSATNKIIVLTLVAAVMGMGMDLGKLPNAYRLALIAILALAGFGWCFGKILFNKDGLSFWLYSVGTLIYVCGLSMGMEKLRHNGIALNSAVIALGTGTSISAILGSSALLGQLSAALAAGGGALLILTLFMQKPQTGSSISTSAGLGTALLGCGAVLLASMPWYTLIILALIPLIQLIPDQESAHWFKRAARYFIPAILIAGLAIVSVWLGMEETSSGY